MIYPFILSGLLHLLFGLVHFQYMESLVNYTPSIRSMQCGYIIFVFSVCLSVCLSVSLSVYIYFCVKDISGTTLPRTLKFCTDDKYD